MIIKLYDNTNTEFGNMQVAPNYVKYYLKYDQEKQSFLGYFELNNTSQNMSTIFKIIQHSTNQNFSHFLVLNDDETIVYGVSMLFQKNQVINIDNGNLYIRMDIEINNENMDTYIQFLNSHNITI